MKSEIPEQPDTPIGQLLAQVGRMGNPTVSSRVNKILEMEADDSHCAAIVGEFVLCANIALD